MNHNIARGPQPRAGQTAAWSGLISLAIAVLVVGLDTTVVVTALPTLATDLSASTIELQWVLNAYTLALAGLLLPIGVLGDRIGRRRMLLLGLALFGVASVGASEVRSTGALIALRVVMGIGASAIATLSFAMLPSLFPEQSRPRAVAVLAATVFLGLPLGPLVGGWLLVRFGWGSIFLLNLPVIAVAVVGVLLFLPESRAAHPSRADWRGAVLSVSGITALVYGVVEQPVYGWGDVRVLAGVSAGAVLVAGFVAHQLRTRTPLVDLRLFRRTRFGWSTIAFAVTGFSLGGLLFTLTSFLQSVQGNDAQATGLRLLPLIAGIVVAAVPSDRLTGWLGTRAMIAGGLLATGAGAALLSTVTAHASFATTARAEAVIGLGLGLTMPAAMDAILSSLPEDGAGGGIAVARTLQFVAMSVGVAVLGSILNRAYRGGLDGHLTGLSPRAGSAVREGLGGASATGVGHVIRAARAAYVDGMGQVMVVSATVLVSAAMLVAVFMRSGSKGVDAAAT